MIVGAGTFGASLAWQLAGRGDEVVLVDQYEPGDVRATSGGNGPAGLVRHPLLRLLGLGCLAALLLPVPSSSTVGRAEAAAFQDDGMDRQQLLVLREAFQLVNRPVDPAAYRQALTEPGSENDEAIVEGFGEASR